MPVIQQDHSRHRTAELGRRSGVGLPQDHFFRAEGVAEITKAAYPDAMNGISLGTVPEARIPIAA